MCAATSVCEIKDGKFISYEIAPEQFGYERCEKGALTGGTPEENAKITMEILSGADKGPKRQAVCLNAGAAIYIAGKADTIEAENFYVAERTRQAGYSLNNANLKIRRRAGRLSTKISNPAVCRLLILVDSHPALYFLLEFRACWEKMFWHEGKFSDLKSLISALAVA